MFVVPGIYTVLAIALLVVLALLAALLIKGYAGGRGQREMESRSKDFSHDVTRPEAPGTSTAEPPRGPTPASKA